MNELILAVMEYLRTRDGVVRLEDLYAKFPEREAIELGEALALLEHQHLIRTPFQRDSLQLTLAGRTAVDDVCVLELTLGADYIRERYSASTVHIIVRGIGRDESGGTGFFSADYPGWIITAAHIVRNRQVLRVEDQEGMVLSRGPFQVRAGSEQLDIAFLSCPLGNNIVPLAIEWREEMIRPMQQLVILGYPEYPLHEPALHHSRAELHAVTAKFGIPFSSFIISSVTRPGFSGGPVISERGRVIAIVEEENIGENENRHPNAFFSAVPARYSREIAENEGEQPNLEQGGLEAPPVELGPPAQQGQ